MATARGQSVTFRDNKGHTATFRFYVKGATVGDLQTNANAIGAAFAALSNCAVQSTRGPWSNDPIRVTYGTTAVFASVEDKAVLTYQDPTGGYHRFKVPAPLSALFLADGETVDSTNSLIVALNTAIDGVMVTADGAEPLQFIGGIRTRVKIRRRANINTKAPDLVQPEE